MKKPFEDMIQQLKKLGLLNRRVGVIAAWMVLLTVTEIFFLPPWFEFWMFLPVIILWGVVQSYKYSKADREAGE